MLNLMILTRYLTSKSSTTNSGEEYSPSDDDNDVQSSLANFSFLHLVNDHECVEREQPAHDRLLKVHSIMDLLIPFFQQCSFSVYGFSSELSLDEMTIVFKGRSTLKLDNS